MPRPGAQPAPGHAERRMTGPVPVRSDRFDALFVGTVFLDIVLAGLPHLPSAGTESWAASRAVSPGGVANHAVAAARLGLSSALVAAIGDDSLGDLVWRALRDEPLLDLRWSRRVPGLATALTVALAHGRERSFVSHGVLDPVPVERLVDKLPESRSCFLSLDTGVPDWLRAQRATGSIVFADVGWDPSRDWSAAMLDNLAEVDVFLPNATEAMAYTRTGSAREALHALAAYVPLVVVTCGPRGAMALDAGTGEEVALEAPDVEVVDPTGAGDIFTAAFMAATLSGAPLAERVSYANRCASLSVQSAGGALSAPTKAALAGAAENPRVVPRS